MMVSFRLDMTKWLPAWGRRLGWLACLGTLTCLGHLGNRALAAADAPRRVDFAADIQPLLRRCAKCHGPENQEAGLRLDDATGLRAGGDAGPAVVAGKPQESRLLQAVRGEGDVPQMPPEGPPLTEEQIALLETWVRQGAVMPEATARRDPRYDHWAFQRPVRPPLPKVSDVSWPRNAIDYFVLARLEREGIRPAREADRATLIRRVSLDLRGLPPTPAEVEGFLEDKAPGAYERLVDRLLASPAYGERWGRHWLDLARYADSNGYTRDFGREMWKYRDWVIRAVNRDMPFDQFTIEQFAGDLLPRPTLDQRIATGFHRNTLINEEGGTDAEQFRVEAVADRVATTGSVYLGLTLGCARCHQHKYDPISQREYYQLFAFLNQCDEPTIDAPSEWQVEQGLLDRREEIRGRIKELESELAELGESFARERLAWERTITPEQRAKLPGPVQASLDLPPEKRDETQQQLVADLFKKSEAARQAFPQVAEIAQLRAAEPRIPTTMVLSRRAEPRETFVHRRGNFLDHGVRVEPRVPDVLHPLPSGSETADRLALARWLVDPANPLTPRVVVNRYWQRFFGRGIVATENDFGLQGIPPTHPRLLDWLACEFVAADWSVKRIHRLIVTSATYRQSSHARPELNEIDPNNELLARQVRLRLEAEIIRDAALAAAGLLSRRVGGPSVHPPQQEGVFQFTQDPKPWDTEQGADRYRRGMYTFFWRSSPYPDLMVFDFPNSNVTCTRRVRSNTPLQSLTLANSQPFLECAGALAERVLRESAASDAGRVRHSFQLCLARSPSPAEAERLEQFVAAQRESFQGDPQAAAELLASLDVARQRRGRGADSGEPVDAYAGDEDQAEANQTHGTQAAGNQVDDVERAVWVATTRVLLNLDEFITRE